MLLKAETTYQTSNFPSKPQVPHVVQTKKNKNNGKQKESKVIHVPAARPSAQNLLVSFLQ